MHEKHVILKAFVYGFVAAIITIAVGSLITGCEVCTDDATFGSSCDPPKADAGRDGGARD